ncbi:MAG: DUF3078 domain-containing protein [Bacteroidota bacterium]
MRKRGGLVLLWVWLMSAIGGGQSLMLKDTLILVALKNLDVNGLSLVKFCFTQDLEYSFTFSNILFLNWQQGNSNSQFSLLQRIKYRSQLNNTRNFTISTSFVHNLGIQFYFDSISRFQPDENTLDTRIEIRLRKNITFSLTSNLSTRLFNAYDYSSDQTGSLLKTLNSSFLTPLLCTFSAGLALTVPRVGMISLGLSAAKLTFIGNREIYTQNDILEFYGVPKEKRFVFEYGLSMHLLVDKNFLKRFQWNCDLLIFKNYEKPVDLVMKNLIGVRLNKFLKTSIQTRLFYEKQVSKSIQVENLVSLGFYFNLLPVK